MHKLDTFTYWNRGGMTSYVDHKLVLLNFSGGTQSTALLWMFILDEIETPDNLCVTWADTGMEKIDTYKHINNMGEQCLKKGIRFELASGPNLYDALMNFKESGWVGNPPYFTKKPNGKSGKLMQKCTNYYKIRPLKKLARKLLYEYHGINTNSTHIGRNTVLRLIGFSSDEINRLFIPENNFETFCFPLMDLKMDKTALIDWYNARNLKIPPRSMCNACFAHGLSSPKDLKENRPEDWAQAVSVDNAIRDMSSVGVNYPVYVSSTLTPLEEITFKEDEYDEKLFCDQGVCFL